MDCIGKLSYKGYSIPFNTEHHNLIKNDLMVKPFVLPDYDFNVKKFPVYRKSEKCLYLPKFYGLEKYGPPSGTPNERMGDDIDLKFKGELKNLQKPVIKKVLENLERSDSTVLSLSTGLGKCLAKDTGVIMYDGSVVKVQDITVGDSIMGDDSTPRCVLSIAHGEECMYEIHQTKRYSQSETKEECRQFSSESYTVNASHILSLKNPQTGEVIDVGVKEYLNSPETYRQYLGYRVPLDFATNDELPMDPYIAGGWLTEKHTDGEVRRIPDMYKCNSKDNRLMLLGGIMDSKNCLMDLGSGKCVATLETELLAKDVRYLCRSLGFECYVVETNHMEKSGIYYEVTFWGEIEEIPLTYEFKITPKGVGEYYGFEIDGNRRFVLESFDVTHNTVIGLYTITMIKKKTLIIVHKEFLLNQWKERIKQFLPDARVGVIKQKTIDIEDKDIVIAMLQSITVRKENYPKETFDSFGYTLIDECHRICSRTFSKALFQVATKKSLGLSATPDRKDGLTKVLKWFLGDITIIESGNVELKPDVKLVKANYDTDNPPTPKYNVAGKVNLPNLVTQISLDPVRDNQILREIRECNSDNRRILVLTERRKQCENLLKLLPQEISGGLYVGGMKNELLEISNTKDVIFATYAMAQEGYDNSCLDTLIFATGRSDIVQACGRIIRKKNTNKPLIIDFQDNLECMAGQAKKRERYYRKKGYVVNGGNNNTRKDKKRFMFAED